MACASDSTPAPEFHPAPGPVTRAIRAVRSEPVDPVALVRAALDALAPEIDPDAIHDAEPVILAGDLARRLQAEEWA